MFSVMYSIGYMKILISLVIVGWLNTKNVTNISKWKYNIKGQQQE